MQTLHSLFNRPKLNAAQFDADKNLSAVRAKAPKKNNIWDTKELFQHASSARLVQSKKLSSRNRRDTYAARHTAPKMPTAGGFEIPRYAASDRAELSNLAKSCLIDHGETSPEELSTCLRAVKKFCRKRPGDYLFRLLLSLLYFRMNDIDEAILEVEKLYDISRESNDDKKVYGPCVSVMAAYFYEKENFLGAVDFAYEAKGIDKKNQLALNIIALVEERYGKHLDNRTGFKKTQKIRKFFRRLAYNLRVTKDSRSKSTYTAKLDPSPTWILSYPSDTLDPQRFDTGQFLSKPTCRTACARKNPWRAVLDQTYEACKKTMSVYLRTDQ